MFLNLDATEGLARVRVSRANRDPIEGFNYEDCTTLTADGVREKVTWKGHSLDELTGEEIRFEFYLERADLFAFVAGGANP